MCTQIASSGSAETATQKTTPADHNSSVISAWLLATHRLTNLEPEDNSSELLFHVFPTTSKKKVTLGDLGSLSLLLPSVIVVVVAVDRFYIVLFSTLEQTHCTRM